MTTPFPLTARFTVTGATLKDLEAAAQEHVDALLGERPHDYKAEIHVCNIRVVESDDFERPDVYSGTAHVEFSRTKIPGAVPGPPPSPEPVLPNRGRFMGQRHG